LTIANRSKHCATTKRSPTVKSASASKTLQTKLPPFRRMRSAQMQSATTNRRVFSSLSPDHLVRLRVADRRLERRDVPQAAHFAASPPECARKFAGGVRKRPSGDQSSRPKPCAPVEILSPARRTAADVREVEGRARRDVARRGNTEGGRVRKVEKRVQVREDD
jgi:hypothetical protein